MVARTASLNEEDIWHVQVSDGDVRIVTVDQLDDLFRLDLIDDNVNVWQPGMPVWQPLKVVAGMDEDDLKQVPPVSRPPPPPPKRAVAEIPMSALPWAPTPSFAQTFAPASLSPVVTSSMTSDLDFRARSGGGGFGRVLLGLLAVAGIAVTVYRNGLVRDAAHAMSQDALYKRAEAALGPPGFGTLSSVDRLTGAATITLSANQPAAVSAPEPAHASAAAAIKLPEPSAPAPAAPAPAPAAAAAVAKTPDPPAKSVSLDTLPREGSAAPATPSRAAVAPAGGTPKASASAKPGKGLSTGLKGSSNAYDPLNGKL